jgi:hypothetical protein
MPTLRVHHMVMPEHAEARAWYAARSVLAPLNFDRCVRAALEEIATHPTSHAIWRSIFRRCRLAGFPYLAIFHCDSAFVSVLALVHHRRDSGRTLAMVRDRLDLFS